MRDNENTGIGRSRNLGCGGTLPLAGLGKVGMACATILAAVLLSFHGSALAVEPPVTVPVEGGSFPSIVFNLTELQDIQVNIVPKAGWSIVSSDMPHDDGRCIWTADPQNANNPNRHIWSAAGVHPSYQAPSGPETEPNPGAIDDTGTASHSAEFHGILSHPGPGVGPGGQPPEFWIALGDVDIDCDSDNNSQLTDRAPQETDEEDEVEMGQGSSLPKGMEVSPADGWVAVVVKAFPQKDSTLSLQLSSTQNFYVGSKTINDIIPLQPIAEPRSPKVGTVYDEADVSRGLIRKTYYLRATGTSGTVTVMAVMVPKDRPAEAVAVDQVLMTALPEDEDTNRDDLVEVGDDLLGTGRDTGVIGWQAERDQPQVYIPLAASVHNQLVVHAYITQGAVSRKNALFQAPLDEPQRLWQFYSFDTKAEKVYEGKSFDNPNKYVKLVSVVRPRGNTVLFQFDQIDGQQVGDPPQYKTYGVPTGVNSKRTYVLRSVGAGYELQFNSGIIHQYAANGSLTTVSHLDGRAVSCGNMGGVGAMNPHAQQGQTVAESPRYVITFTWDTTSKLLRKVTYTDRVNSSVGVVLDLAADCYDSDGKIIKLKKKNLDESQDIPEFTYSVSGTDITRDPGQAVKITRSGTLPNVSIVTTTSRGNVTESFVFNTCKLPLSYSMAASGVADTYSITNSYSSDTGRYAHNGAPTWAEVTKVSRSPDGWWEAYDYNRSGTCQTGWIKKRITSYHGSTAPTDPATADPAIYTIQEYDYAKADPNDLVLSNTGRLFDRARTIITKIGGVETGRQYYKYSDDGYTINVQETTQRGDAWGAAGNINSTISHQAYGPDSVTGPTGGTTVGPTSYCDMQGKLWLYLSQYGTGTTATGSTFIRRNGFGYAEKVEVFEGASRVYLADSTLDAYGFGRLATTTCLYGLTSKEEQHGIWGPGKVTGTDGSATMLYYDNTGLVSSSTLYPNGTVGSSRKVEETYTRDSLGQVKLTSVTAAKSGEATISYSVTSESDILGRLKRYVDPASKETQYGYAIVGGCRQTTITYPNAQTAVIQQYMDGPMKSVSGSAVYARNYDYGPSGSGPANEVLWVSSSTPSGSDWSKSYYDCAGLKRKVLRAKPGGGSVTATIQYDNKFRPDTYTGYDGIPVQAGYDERSLVNLIKVGGVDRVGFTHTFGGSSIDSVRTALADGSTVTQSQSLTSIQSSFKSGTRTEVQTTCSLTGSGNGTVETLFAGGMKNTSRIAGGDVDQVQSLGADSSTLATIPVIQDALGRTRQYTYRNEQTSLQMNNVGFVTQVASGGHTWGATPNEMMQPQSMTRADGRNVTMHWGNKLEYKGADGAGVYDHIADTESNRPLTTNLTPTGGPASVWSYYDEAPMLKDKTLGGELVASVTYDGAMRLWKVEQLGPAYTATVEYWPGNYNNAPGAPKSVTFTDGSSVTHNYDSKGRSRTIDYVTPGVVGTKTLGFQYDTEDRIHVEELPHVPSGQVTINYDGSGRLSGFQASLPGGSLSHTYSYDAQGRSSGVNNGRSYAWGYQAGHLMGSVTYNGQMRLVRSYTTGPSNLLASQVTEMVVSGTTLHSAVFGYDTLDRRQDMDIRALRSDGDCEDSYTLRSRYDDTTSPLTASGTATSVTFMAPGASAIDNTYAAIRAGGTDLNFDFNRSGTVDRQDVDDVVHNLMGTEYGDADLNGIVDQTDYGIWYNHYGMPGGWTEGNWQADSTSINVDQDDFAAWYNHYSYTAPPVELTATAVSDTRVDLCWVNYGRFGNVDVTVEKNISGAGWQLSGTASSGVAMHTVAAQPNTDYQFRLLIGGNVISTVSSVRTPQLQGPTSVKDHLTQQFGVSGDKLILGSFNWYQYDGMGNRLGAVEQSGVAGAWTSDRNKIVQRASAGRLHLGGFAKIDEQVTLNVSGTRYAAHRDGTMWFAAVPVGGAAGADVSIEVREPSGRISRTESFSRVIRPAGETYSYDASGNKSDDSRYHYTWDSQHRLKSVETVAAGMPESAKVRVEYEYDPLGRRTQKVVKRSSGGSWTVASTTKFVWAGWLMIAETDGSDVILRSYTWGADLSGSVGGAAGVGGLLEVKDHVSGKVYWPITDASGNVKGLVDSTGGSGGGPKLVASFEYGPFGELTMVDSGGGWSNPAALCPFLFSTKYYDAEIGLYYYGYRYYEPSAGKWLNRDPLAEEGGLNLYGYCQNDPVSAVDPLGDRILVSTDAQADFEKWYVANVTLGQKISSGNKPYLGEGAYLKGEGWWLYYYYRFGELLPANADIDLDTATEMDRVLLAMIVDPDNVYVYDKSGWRMKSDADESNCLYRLGLSGYEWQKWINENVNSGLAYVGDFVSRYDKELEELDIMSACAMANAPHPALRGGGVVGRVSSAGGKALAALKGLRVLKPAATFLSRAKGNVAKFLVESGPMRSLARQGVQNGLKSGDINRIVGALRELRVISHYGKEVLEQGRKIEVLFDGVMQKGEIDVILKNNVFIQVGGGAKTVPGISKQLGYTLEYAKQFRGSAVRFIYAPGTKKDVIEKAIEMLGEGNVLPLP